MGEVGDDAVSFCPLVVPVRPVAGAALPVAQVVVADGRAGIVGLRPADVEGVGVCPRHHGWRRRGVGLLRQVGDGDVHLHRVAARLVVGDLDGDLVAVFVLIVQGFPDLYLSGFLIDVERGCVGALQRVLELALVVDVLVGRADRVPHWGSRGGVLRHAAGH